MQNTKEFGREKLADGVYFSHVIDPKFYSNRMMINLITRLDRETATCNAVVPAILRSGCAACPDMTALNRRLGLLYGATLDGGATAFGESQILNVFVRGLDRRVTLGDEDMAGQLVGLLCDVALDPLVMDGGFSPAYTEVEKQNLIDEIESEINDKRMYAQERCIKLLFGDSPRSIRPCGTVEMARAVTPRSAYEAYRRLLEEARVEVLFIGSGDYAAARDAFARRFAKVRRSPRLWKPEPPVFPESPLEKTEIMEVGQSKLVLGFSCSPQSERDVNALRMMSAMFGGTPFSKLFLNVREKMGLCYYCSSRYDRGNQMMMVSSGVEHDQRVRARDEILLQLDELREGRFTDEELQNTILAMNTSFAATGDSLYALGNWYLTQILNGTMHSPAEEQERMAGVTRAEVADAARRTQLKAEYFLTGCAARETAGEEK